MERKCNKTAQVRRSGTPVLLKYSANRPFPQPVKPVLLRRHSDHSVKLVYTEVRSAFV